MEILSAENPELSKALVSLLIPGRVDDYMGLSSLPTRSFSLLIPGQVDDYGFGFLAYTFKDPPFPPLSSNMSQLVSWCFKPS